MAEPTMMQWRTIAKSPGRQTDEMPLKNGWIIRESYFGSEASSIAVALCFVPKAPEPQETEQ